MRNSKFLRVRCARCRNIQIVFGKASTRVKCMGCNILMAKTSGGKAKIKAHVKEILQ